MSTNSSSITKERFEKLWERVNVTPAAASWPTSLPTLQQWIDDLDSEIKATASLSGLVSSSLMRTAPSVSLKIDGNRSFLTIFKPYSLGGGNVDNRPPFIEISCYGTDERAIRELIQSGAAALLVHMRAFVISLGMTEQYREVAQSLIFQSSADDTRVTKLEQELRFLRYCFRSLCGELSANHENGEIYRYNRIISSAIAYRNAEKMTPVLLSGETPIAANETFIRNVEDGDGKWYGEWRSAAGMIVRRAIQNPIQSKSSNTESSAPAVTAAKTATQVLPNIGGTPGKTPEKTAVPPLPAKASDSQPYEDDGLGDDSPLAGT